MDGGRLKMPPADHRPPIMKAMILAAGFGTRLWPLTIERTKPAIPFLNRPLIAFTIDYLKQFGITEIIVNLHHEPDSVREQIGDGSEYGVKITYSVEDPIILGTAGALDPVRHLLKDETFFVINGKIITNLDLNAALETHRQRKAIATLVMRPNPKREKFSQIIVDEAGNYQGFSGFPELLTTDHQPPTTFLTTPLMFTGIHILEPEILDYIPSGVEYDSIRQVYPQVMSEGKIVAAHVGEGDWYELSTLARYLEISLEFMRRDKIDFTADKGCEIASTANVKDSILWRNVKISSGAKINQCIIADGVRIPENKNYERKVIVRAELVVNEAIPEKATKGVVDGENYVVSI